MANLPVAQTLTAHGTPDATCALDYDARFFRRKKLTTDAGWSFIADFEGTTSLNDGQLLSLSDGRTVQIIAAPEPLIEVRGGALARLAWHIGNRHTPCQIMGDHLLIRDDPVIAHMLDHLGATLTKTTAPFTPEGGAYGHGRTHSHDHGHTAHDH